MFQFFRNNLRWIAGGFLLTYCSSFGQTFFISASIAEWQATFGLSHGEIGRLYMFATLASAMSLPFLGRIIDFMPEGRTILLVGPVLALACLLAAFAPSVAALAVALYLLRLFGQGMMTHIALTATGRWFDAQRGRAVSLVVLGHQGGEATLPLMFAAIAVAFGYQMGWIAAAFALLFVGLPLAYLAYREPREPTAKERDAHAAKPAVRDWTRKEVMADPMFWMLLTATLAPAMIGTTIFYHQDYMTALNAWSPRLFATSLSLLAAMTITFALICGALVDRFGAVTMLPFFLLPLGLTCFAFAGDVPPTRLFVAMIFLGLSYGLSSTLFGSLWPEVYGTAHLGSIRSVTVSAMVFGTAAGPGLTGTLIDQGIPLPEQMTFFAYYCLLIAATMLFVSRHLKRRIDRQREALS